MTQQAMANSRQSSDCLVLRARREADALGQLYDRHYAGVLRYCACRLFSRHIAEDVTSEVFLAVARQIRCFDGQTEQEFVAWLYSIATNRINAHIRSTARRKVLFEEAARHRRALAQADDDPPEQMDWPTLYVAIASLKDREQTLVVLRCFERWPFDQIAAALGLKPVTARVTFNRALKKLRTRLEMPFGRH